MVPSVGLEVRAKPPLGDGTRCAGARGRLARLGTLCPALFVAQLACAVDDGQYPLTGADAGPEGAWPDAGSQAWAPARYPHDALLSPITPFVAGALAEIY